MRSSIQGVILFSINFFPRTAIATHGWLHAGEPDNRNWSLSEETIPVALRARSVLKLIRAITGRIETKEYRVFPSRDDIFQSVELFVKIILGS